MDVVDLDDEPPACGRMEEPITYGFRLIYGVGTNTNSRVFDTVEDIGIVVCVGIDGDGSRTMTIEA